jgi:secondary thiamine-phosphate synthase enzyme
MRQYQQTLTLNTDGQGLTEFTDETARIVAASGIITGLVHVFCRHTSASLLIQENADQDVPDGDPLFIHRSEGADDMPAHVKSALTETTLTVPVAGGRLMLGTWQGIYLFEHRTRPHSRSVVVHVVGE